MTKKNLSIFIPIVFFFGLQLHFIKKKPPENHSPEQSNRANMFMSKASMTQYQSNGSIDFNIQSKRISHLRKTKETIFTTPRITLYSKLKPYWKITSRNATRADDNNIITLKGNVVLQSIHYKKNISKTIIKTKKLIYDPAKQLAVSRSFTQYQHNHVKLTGTGVTVNLKNNQIKIKKQTHFRFTPTQKKQQLPQ